jgi:hypothetical protein
LKTEGRRYEIHMVSSHEVSKNPASPLGIGKQHNQHVAYVQGPDGQPFVDGDGQLKDL